MRLLIQQHSLIEMARLLRINLKDLGKTKYASQLQSIFDDFDKVYRPTLTTTSLENLLKLKRELEILEKVKGSQKVTNETESIIERINDELNRIIQVHKTHEEVDSWTDK